MLVGGLGLSESGTADAIARLPAAVSLGFAPYGADVERDAARAREAGHETLLQLPMEPFDYPANNPGPHTLLSELSEAENLDNLHWLMTRFAGYVGVMNFLGAKFTADPAALTPVLADVASRGLVYVDDGTSPRSLARDKAPALNLRAAGADVVIDADFVAAGDRRGAAAAGGAGEGQRPGDRRRHRAARQHRAYQPLDAQPRSARAGADSRLGGGFALARASRASQSMSAPAIGGEPAERR